jgi:Ser/Thr protein kinase RdoA (MazF antagonist)
MRRDEAQWDSFLGGYLEQRPLSEVDRRAIPVFVAAGVIQLMGGLAEKVAEWGIASVHRSLDFFIPWLRDWEAQLPPDTA